jgi:Arc/MetJ-type ribon-helix-helix transcriptional regulator
LPEPVLPRKRPTSISLTDQQHADLRLMAERRLSSVSQIVRELVQEGVEREKRDEAHDGRP